MKRWVRVNSLELLWAFRLEAEVDRCRGAQLASIRQMNGQVSRGSAGEYQADERAGVAEHARIIISTLVSCQGW